MYNLWGTDEAQTLGITRMSMIWLLSSWNSASGIEIKSYLLPIAQELQKKAAM